MISILKHAKKELVKLKRAGQQFCTNEWFKLHIYFMNKLYIRLISTSYTSYFWINLRLIMTFSSVLINYLMFVQVIQVNILFPFDAFIICRISLSMKKLVQDPWQLPSRSKSLNLNLILYKNEQHIFSKMSCRLNYKPGFFWSV